MYASGRGRKYTSVCFSADQDPSGAPDSDAGKHRMTAAGQAAQHGARLAFVARLAQNVAFKADDGVGSDNGVAQSGRDSQGFAPRQAAHQPFGIAFVAPLVAAGRADGKRDTQPAQKLAPPR